MAQDTHNQAGIAHTGGLVPLLKLLDSKNGSLQHNAASALYGLAENEDNVPDFIRVVVIRKLQDGEKGIPKTSCFGSCPSLFCRRPEKKYLLTTTDWSCLLGFLAHHALSSNLIVPLALCKLANKAMALPPIDAAPPSLTPQVYLGEQYVNNVTLSDVTFLVEDKRFYAHRICLLASSDAFRAMFDGGYRKRT
ncbi:hypothetical protein KIW84_070943 [Lathyrus oleraceus]|uniref:BTB domain-containing protein n=1 Tax=Pisum sativum TaxID=3888 RepID=A0A9D4VH20_PEA|nr:hypothetical protein KIW84_070943 [Pisum sativum]